jgi:hypothetical protein
MQAKVLLDESKTNPVKEAKGRNAKRLIPALI